MADNLLGDRANPLVSIVNATQAAVITAGGDGLITGWNDAAAEMLGWSAAEALGQSLTIIIPAAYREAHEKGMRNYRGDGNSSMMGRPVELKAQSRDGHVFSCELFIGTWGSEEGRGFYGVLRDISDRRVSQEQAQQIAHALRLRTEEMARLSYIASHELQEPLRALSGLSDVISDGLTDHENPMLAAAASHLKVTAERMSRMVHDMLQLSRIGRLDDPHRWSLAALAKEVVAEKQEELDACNAHVEIGELPDVYADRQDVLNMWRHILTNTLQYRRPDVPLEFTVSAVDDDGVWRVLIEDNGNGIDHVNPSEAFAVFRQFEREKTEGSGIGLAYVRRVAECFGGRAELWNRPTQGLCLTLIVPKHMDFES